MLSALYGVGSRADVRLVLGGRQSQCPFCIGWEAELMLSDLSVSGGRQS